MRSELFKTALQSYKDELAKCLQEGGEGKRISAFLEKIDHQIPLSQHMFDVAWQHQQSKVDELKKDFAKAKLSDIRHANLAQDLIKERDELQKRVDLLEGKIKEALNTVYAMKGKADCDHLTDKEQSFVYGFGYELHEILKEEQALKVGCDEAK